ncbi:MAG TPA: diguanylate cyclase [Candidatus Acidoferrales bacterium]|jgi:diguanylate cyclase (GGDEF)-like protein|nr:diguanylate cyclase [Candidatus Acidoferrales bacterium]
MASDLNKHLDRARRSLEKNKLREAVAEYQAVLEEAPANQEALQALADIYTRLNEPALAAQYYGAQFDRHIEAGDAAKASAIFTRFLRTFPQPPDRLMRYGILLQKQNRSPEAIEQFSNAADLFLEHQRDIDALACYESIALLDPENVERHVVLGDLAERLKHADLAARSFLRAGQLAQAAGGLDQALEYFGRAHRLLPNDRTGALLFADAKLRKGDAEGAVALLDPLSPNERDTAFLSLFGEALLRTNRLDRAREIFEAYYRQKPENFGKLFELAAAYLRASQDQKAASLLAQTKEWMYGARREADLVAQIERLAASYPKSLALAETVAHLYEELNRETKYFDALVRLFDLYLDAERVPDACEILDRLVDIDPYDYRNQERIARLEGKADPVFLQNILARAAKAATVSSHSGAGFAGAGSDVAASSAPVSEEVRAQQALEDLIVQVEIFLQYSLHTKAIERLERIGELFPGEEEKNERLRTLYERADWWPKGAPRKPASQPPPPAPIAAAPAAPPPAPVEPVPAPAAPSAPFSAAETHRDLSTIAEINRLMHRQSTPREVLSATAAEVGKYLAVARCLVTLGSAGEASPLTAEYSAPGLQVVGGGHLPAIVSLVSKISPDELGGIQLTASSAPVLRELGVESALAVVLQDKEAGAQSGVLLVADKFARKWKSNESFFLQAVGDQLVLSVNHTRLRSLVRSLAVADEKTGLLSRGAYVDCLLVESNRARAQGTRLSLIILHVDHGGDLLRQHGDAAVDQYIEQLARALSSAVRQTDIAVKYTAWSLAFILPDTSIENARVLAEKLTQIAGTVNPSWGSQSLSVSAVVAEASSRPGDDTEDRVTEWINRAEAGLDQAFQNGGNALVPLATP